MKVNKTLRAEDTVMREVAKRPCVFTSKGQYRTPWSIADNTAKAQAKITWDAARLDMEKQLADAKKTGYEEGRLYGKEESLLNQANIDQQVEDATRAGRKEIIEWIRKKLNEITCISDAGDTDKAITSLIFELKDYEQ